LDGEKRAAPMIDALNDGRESWVDAMAIEQASSEPYVLSQTVTPC